jgi:hypothetical protein
MKTRPITFHLPVPSWPTRATLWRFARRLFPTPGNVIFTCALVTTLALANRAGALTQFAPNAPSTQVMPYQGRLAGAGGSALSGNYAMTFALYDVVANGVPLWTETWTGPNSVTVRDGLFNVALGSLSAIPQIAIANRANVWLGITVGSDTEMNPRVQLGSVPFAVQALTVPDGSITQAKFAPGLSLVPPAGSITTTMLADGAVTAEKIALGVPRLLGHKTCDWECGDVVETGLAAGYYVVKGASVADPIEVTLTTNGNPVLVHMTTRFKTAIAAERYCGFQVVQGATIIRTILLDGEYSLAGTDYGCSGSYLVLNLPAGTYRFRAIGFFNQGPTNTVTWMHNRQILVYQQ